MQKHLILGFLALLLLASHTVLADSTQQYNKIFLNPFYLPTLANNQNVSFLVNVNPPDHVGSVVSAIINFQVYSTGQTVTYNLWVNNQACNNPSFTITTSVSGSGARSISFDCSNVISKSGTYNITLRPSGANEGATSGWLDLVYMNNPNGQIIMHGTDYTIDDNAKIWIQLLDSNLDAINNALCTADIYYPNGTRFREQQELSFLEDGVYTYDFIAPSTIGVYPAVARCFYGTGLKSFSLSNGTIINGTLNSGSYLDTFVNDGTTWSVSSIANNGTTQLLTLNLTFSNITQPANMTSYIFDIFTKTTIGVGTPISVSFFNFTSNQLQAMPNSIIASAVNTETSNTYFTNNLTNLGIMNSAGTILIQIKVLFTQGSSRTFQIDFAASQLVGLLNDSFQTVRGSSELNVRNMPLQVWNYTTRTLTDYNLSEILGIVTKINNTVITINGTASRIEVNTIAINSTVNRIESDSLAINSTVNRIDSTTLSINQTSTSNNLLLVNLTSVVNSISSYLNGFITNILLSINSTVTSINAKNFTPTIIVNLTENETTNVFPTFNVSFNGTVNTVVVVNLTENETTNVFPTFNLTTNVTNVTVIVNTTNTTVIVNTTQVNLNNITVVENLTQVNLQNITVVVNTTNTTVVVNTTNTSVIVNTTQVNLNNITVVENLTQINLQNITAVLNVTNTTVVVNTTQVNLNNITVVENITNTTVVVNTTVVNLQNITVVENLTQVNLDNITVVVNTTNTTVIVNTTQVNLQNITVVENITNTTVLINATNLTELTGLAQDINLTGYQNAATLEKINNTVLGINSTVDSIQTYLLGFVTSSLNSIYANTNFTVTYLINILTPVLGDFQTFLTNINNTVTDINAKNFTVIENITNTTVIVNTTQVNLNNITVVENLTQVNLNNITVVVNTTNTTVLVNVTNTTVTPVINISNVTAIVNTTQLVNDLLNAQITETILTQQP